MISGYQTASSRAKSIIIKVVKTNVKIPAQKSNIRAAVPERCPLEVL